jgi:Mce-associated membrane protein
VNVDDKAADQTVANTSEVETTEGVEADKAARRKFALRANVVAVVLVLLLLVSGGLVAWLYFTDYRPDRQTDNAAAQSAVAAAREGTVALLSYKPETLEQDFTTAKSHLTGDFLGYYEKFTREIVTPAAKEKAVKTSAQVVSAAVSELHPDSAAVLVFVNQTTTSKDRPDPSMSASSVLVSLTRANGRWLITKFDPV